MPFAEYEAHDALGLAELVRTKQVTPLELVEEAIVRIERWNPRLNAIVTRMDREAREAAKAPEDGPFHGVPYVLKDLGTKLRGVPLRGGSRLYRGVVPDHDDELALRHRRAGLVCVAKSSTPELGLAPVTEPPIHPPTETPWRAGHTSGGSSGGSASAVAARLVPIGHAGDGGGSIRIPAACCGVFGLKPTRGRTPCGPDISEMWFGFAIQHAVTRSVRDSAAMLDATSGIEPGAIVAAPAVERPFLEEAGLPPGRLRVGFTTKPILPGTVHRDCAAAVDDAGKLLASLGHDVEEAHPPIDGLAFARDFVTHIAVATATELAQAGAIIGRTARRADVDTETWIVAMFGRTIPAVELALARARLFAQVKKLVPYFAKYDVLLTPTMGRPPVRHGELAPKGAEAWLHELVVKGDLKSLFKLPGLVDGMAAKVFDFIPFTPIANVSGQPSMSVPLFWNSDGLPIGTMFTGRFGDEATLFRLAAQLESARPWSGRRPL